MTPARKSCDQSFMSDVALYRFMASPGILFPYGTVCLSCLLAFSPLSVFFFFFSLSLSLSLSLYLFLNTECKRTPHKRRLLRRRLYVGATRLYGDAAPPSRYPEPRHIHREKLYASPRHTVTLYTPIESIRASLCCTLYSRQRGNVEAERQGDVKEVLRKYIGIFSIYFLSGV